MAVFGTFSKKTIYQLIVVCSYRIGCYKHNNILELNVEQNRNDYGTGESIAQNRFEQSFHGLTPRRKTA